MVVTVAPLVSCAGGEVVAWGSLLVTSFVRVKPVAPLLACFWDVVKPVAPLLAETGCFSVETG